jgi:hypothetical protein
MSEKIGQLIYTRKINEIVVVGHIYNIKLSVFIGQFNTYNNYLKKPLYLASAKI